MSNAHYEIDGSTEPVTQPRRVSLSDTGSGGSVYIKVKDVVVAAFHKGADHLEIYCPNTEITGLAAGGGGLLEVK